MSLKEAVKGTEIWGTKWQKEAFAGTKTPFWLQRAVMQICKAFLIQNKHDALYIANIIKEHFRRSL